jgi:CubicO group peptidase (beta-lactamase class C family)
MLLLEGRSPVTNETVIPPSVIQATKTPHAVFEEASTPHHPYIGSKSYGLGQFIYDYRNHQLIEHFGCVPGQMSRILRVPEKGLGLVVMANDNEYGVTFIEVVYHMLLDRLLGLEPLDWKKRYVTYVIP